ncbi:thermonuclease family protein, partial [Blastomonas sp. UPD001]|uniref:thermonuclease family protein n=1 Tax=Blastomonas sp. UPD001 TaxID=2217673 RepID=UPI001300B06D
MRIDTSKEALIALERPSVETIRVPVLHVLDGDGFRTQFMNPRTRSLVNANVRFGFIDAPEVGQFGGDEARNFLRQIIADRWIDLVVLTKMDTGQITDRHGRLVCVPYLLDDQPELGTPLISPLGLTVRQFIPFGCTSRNIELEMVLNGWAWVLDRYEPEDAYFDALDDARRNRRGIWSRDDNVHPWEFKKDMYRRRVVPKRPQSQIALPLQDPG